MKKRFLKLALLIVTLIAAFAITAIAETYGDLNYTLSNGEVSIIKCTKNYGNIVIPNEIEGYPVTSIGDDAFRDCSGVLTVEFPDSLTSVGNYAFYGCKNLTIIDIPKGVTVIGDYAFGYCSGLSRITLPDSLTKIGNSAFYQTKYYNDESNWEDDALYIGNYLVDFNSFITNCTIKEGTLVIADSAFANKSSLKSVSISKGMTTIGARAFYGCSSLSSIILPEGITTIGERAFYGCSSLSSIILPEGITTIEQSAFYNTAYYNNSYNWENDTVLYIGEYLIEAKRSLSGEYEIKKGTELIANSAFYGCVSLTSITIPEGVVGIGNNSFDNCENLTKISLPEGLKNIGDYAFMWCSKLTEIIIPKGITKIGSNTFNVCKSLTSIILPEGLISIGNDAFNYCTSLTSIAIPEGLKSIGDYAFYYCTNLTSISVPKSTTHIGDYALGYYSDGGYKVYDKFIIYGCVNSVAETYAIKNKISFVVLDSVIDCKGVSLLLDGSIGVKIYVDYDSQAVDKNSIKTKVTFENSDNNTVVTEEVELNFDEENETAHATVYVSPKDIDNITIHAKIESKTQKGTSLEPVEANVTIPYYIEELKEMAETDEDCAKALDTVVALENYCAYANAFFNELDMDTVTLLADEETNLSKVTAPKRSGSINGLTFSQTSLILEERVAIRHYFEVASGSDLSNYTVEGASALTMLENSKKYAYVDVENIPAHELSKQYKVTLTDGVNTMTIEFSAINYVNLNKNNADTSLSNLVKTVYRYSVEADKYYKLLNPDEEEEVIEPPFDEDELPKTEW